MAHRTFYNDTKYTAMIRDRLGDKIVEPGQEGRSIPVRNPKDFYHELYLNHPKGVRTVLIRECDGCKSKLSEIFETSSERKEREHREQEDKEQKEREARRQQEEKDRMERERGEQEERERRKRERIEQEERAARREQEEQDRKERDRIEQEERAARREQEERDRKERERIELEEKAARREQEERERKERERIEWEERAARREQEGGAHNKEGKEREPTIDKKDSVGLPKTFKSIGAHLMMDEFGLNEEDCELVVTDEHLEEFSRCYGENWKKVTAYLELKSIVFKDIDRKNVDEGEKRFTFFTEWKILKSSSATYEKLVSAFLKIGDRDDAEALCKMLKSSIDKDPSIRDTKVEQSVYSEDVKHQLRLNYKDIIGKYASYVRCILTMLREKNVSKEDLCLFLLILLRDHPSVAAKVERATTLLDIFFVLQKYFSFWDFDIFQQIVVEYDLDSKNEKLQYAKHFESYIHSHNVSEFIDLHPCILNSSCSNPEEAKELTLKFDYDITKCSLADVRAFKEIVATTLNVQPSALRLLDIREGCMEVTCLVPTQIADDIFTDDWKAVVEKLDKFQKMSLLSITCNNSTLVTKEKKLVPAGEVRPNLTTLGSSITEESHEEAKSTILKLMKVLINPVDAGTACDTSVLLQEIKTCQEIMEGIATNQDDSTSLLLTSEKEVICKFAGISHMVMSTTVKEDVKEECKAVCEESFKFLSVLGHEKSANEEIAMRAYNLNITTTIYLEKIMDLLITDEEEAKETSNIGGQLDEKFASTAQAIEVSSQRIQEMRRRSHDSDSGVKLEVNEKVLAACADIMKAMKNFLTHYKDLLLRIVQDEMGNATDTNKFFKRRSRWSRELLSLTQQIGKGAGTLVETVDRAVSSATNYSAVGIASQSITASIAQLVALCGIRLKPQSDGLAHLMLLSVNVLKAKREVVTMSGLGFILLEKKGIVDTDYAQMSFTKVSRLRMELETRVQKLEKELEVERTQLPLMKREGKEMESKMKMRYLEEELAKENILLSKIRNSLHILSIKHDEHSDQN